MGINTARWFVKHSTSPYPLQLSSDEDDEQAGMVDLRARRGQSPPSGSHLPLHGRTTRAAERAYSQGPSSHSQDRSSRRSLSNLPQRSAAVAATNRFLTREDSSEDVLGDYTPVDEPPKPSRKAMGKRKAVIDDDDDDGEEEFKHEEEMAAQEEEEEPYEAPDPILYDSEEQALEPLPYVPDSEMKADIDLPPSEMIHDPLPSDDDDYAAPRPLKSIATTTLSGRRTKRVVIQETESEDDLPKPPGRRSREMAAFVDDDEADMEGDYGESNDNYMSRRERLSALAARSSRRDRDARPSGRRTRNSRAARGLDDDDYEQGTSEEEVEGYTLRQRSKVDYKIPTLDQLQAAEKTKDYRSKYKNKSKRSKRSLPLNMSGAQLSRLFGEAPQEDSSDDDKLGTPRKGMYASGMLPGGLFAGNAGNSSLFDLAAGTPSNLGKLSGAQNLADVDPLLPSATMSFEKVGGLDSHVQQLKEMVSLPLLYPEVFRRFNITPPRGVLFHGPPGTGKTLLARALAASCSTEGQKISFFMRKGADCLSKWVGEAERQLRLLFDEAKACQPSIIFFDEIDGLAPVRSSKQEQIHASIVSTLLALMDGMDGRGQVIVIGATNRPDAIDPALRRPGRFDREFYFPLPNIEGRRKILEIHTDGWQPPLPEGFLDELAGMTKGYGGADLRALCTEAALNAVQRRYPQIYKTNDRLLIQPETIDIKARDFVIATKRLVPSSARATSSLAAALPSQLEPLLRDAVDRCKAALATSLPDIKKINVLEEAEYEQEEDDDGGFAREKRMQTFDTLRVHRPRLLVYGQSGMGQAYVGPAVLQHLEGFHVQSLDYGNLVSDSSRTVEAACVQLFTEAKRHKPSILYIPSLTLWASAVTDTIKATIKGLLDGLEPSEPVLLFAIVDGPLSEIPADIRSWFGFVRSSRVSVDRPSAEQRGAFFVDALESVRRPPTDFPDAVPRKKRVLEELPKAPPPEPRKPTEKELEMQAQADQRLLNTLKYYLGPILTELKRRFKRFTNPIGEPGEEVVVPQPSEPEVVVEQAPLTNGVHYDDDEEEEVPATEMDVEAPEVVEVQANGQPIEAAAPVAEPTFPSAPFRFHDIDLDAMHHKLYYSRYLTPAAFIADIDLIVQNAEHDTDAEQLTRALQMQNQAVMMVDRVCDAQFNAECVKAVERQAARKREAKDRARSAAEALSRELSPSAAAAAAGQKRKSDDEGMEGEPNAKRARAEDVSEAAVLEGDGNFEAGVPGNAAMDGVELNGDTAEPLVALAASTAPPTHQHVPVAPDDPALTIPLMPPAVSAQGLHDHFTHANGVVEPEKEPEPKRQVELDESAFEALEVQLRHDLADLNVEQLEQLRAALYDSIWRARAQWDRTALVRELSELTSDFAEEVRAHVEEE